MGVPRSQRPCWRAVTLTMSHFSSIFVKLTDLTFGVSWNLTALAIFLGRLQKLMTCGQTRSGYLESFLKTSAVVHEIICQTFQINIKIHCSLRQPALSSIKWADSVLFKFIAELGQLSDFMFCCCFLHWSFVSPQTRPPLFCQLTFLNSIAIRGNGFLKTLCFF